MFNICKCKKCPYIEDVDAVKVSLIDADHVSAFHKLEVNDQFYFNDKKVNIIEITDNKNKTYKVLSI